ncbi:MAG TPA: hypothetical protein VK255_04495 [Patescibacteria group bacterium]|nr:hypothetical protein [Patescibacteria group bacterium]
MKKITESIIFFFFVLTLMLSAFFTLKKETASQKNIADHGMVLAQSIEKPMEWNTYENNNYGFKVKYPNDWQIQEEKINDTDFNYIYKTSFGSSRGFDGETAEGFDVFVYKKGVCLPDLIKIENSARIQGLADLIDNQGIINENCVSRKVAVGDEYFPSSINIYQYTGANYTYVIIPFLSRNASLPEHIQNQYEESVKSFALVSENPTTNMDQSSKVKENILPAKSVPNAQKIPVAPARPQRGTMICPDSQQKPRYSKTKSRHMDEDCCPDPDEWANPQCAYPSAAFKILMAGPPKKK